MTVAARLATRSWTDGPAGSGAGSGEAAGAGGVERAAGPLAVLLHGVTSSSQSWWQVGPGLAGRGYRVLAVDLRGHGASPRTSQGLGLGDLADDVIETLGVDPPGAGPGDPPVDLLVGHSLGALVALGLLARTPGLARRLVLEDPPGPTGVDWTALADSIESDGSRARAEPETLRRDIEAENPEWRPDEVDRRLAELAACDATAMAAAMRGGGVSFDLAGMAAVVRVPTLLVAGREELGSALVGPDRRALVDALAGRGTFEVLGGGHNLHEEEFHPFMETLDRWLGRTGPPRG